MTHDVVTRGGTVVDGNRKTAIGRVPEWGTEEIEAAGPAVTPGFVDLYTHLDTQVGWDPVAGRMPAPVSAFRPGASQLVQRAVGYKATLCNGRVILKNDALTGTRSAQVLRTGRL